MELKYLLKIVGNNSYLIAPEPRVGSLELKCLKEDIQFEYFNVIAPVR